MYISKYYFYFVVVVHTILQPLPLYCCYFVFVIDHFEYSKQLVIYFVSQQTSFNIFKKFLIEREKIFLEKEIMKVTQNVVNSKI